MWVDKSELAGMAIGQFTLRCGRKYMGIYKVLLTFIYYDNDTQTPGVLPTSSVVVSLEQIGN